MDCLLASLFAFFLTAAGIQPPEATPLKGVVRDALGGEPLERVRVSLLCPGSEPEIRQTGSDGRFEFAFPARRCALEASLVGYRRFSLELSSGAFELEVVMTPGTLARRDSIDVHEGPFLESPISSPTGRGLAGTEVKNLAGVLADDPLRAVQALPGVAASNDYAAQFTLRGAGFDRIGIFFDGILLHTPFHSVQSQEETGSLTILNADLIDRMELHPGAPPPEFGDRAAGVLDVRMREGSRRGAVVRANAGVASAGLLAEGPMRRSNRGSWLFSVRKSYLQYLLRRSSAGDSLAFGFLDAQGKLTYDVTRGHNITLEFLGGLSDLDRSQARATLGINSIMNAEYHTSLAGLAWRWSPSGGSIVTNRIAWTRERFENRNPFELPLGGGAYGEWVWNSSAAWSWRKQTPFQAGASARRIHDGGYTARYNFNPLALRRRDEWRGTGLRAGGYAQQSWTGAAGRIGLSAGARWDGYSATGPTAFSPHAAFMLRVAARTTMQAAWSQALQYPPISLLSLERMGNPQLLPPRSSHAVAALEHRLDERTRIRAELFWRADRDLIAQPLLEPRLLADGRIFVPPPYPQFLNSVRGDARGFELLLQRRTANRLSGWISYAFSSTRMHDGVTGARYPSDADQRHTVNVYSSYALRPTLNFSARYSYGSNFPIPGFLRQSGDLFYLAQERNRLRLPVYQRLDMRLAKSIERRSWRGMIYVEVLNLTNHNNKTYDSFSGFNARTGQAFPTFLKLFPIVPAAGIMVEWDRLGSK